jgi:polysaccharide chain length determinant protein (PEP-CTERM system associated)
MVNSGTATGGRPKGPALKSFENPISPEHYLRVILHRKWWVISAFLVVSAATAVVAYRLPDVYTSDTLILVDPQKVPEIYVKSTVTGDVRNRLGTLSQQILSVTRLQKIIDTLNLYPAEKKTMAREDLIAMMRGHIAVSMVGNPGGSQDLQAFRISYTGKEPRLVAQVANELASLFIDENLKAREQQATGTTDFLQNQLEETRKALEVQEAKLRDFRLKHIGEMPEQQSADLQILGQLQSQLQLEGEALARAEQQKSLTQSMMAEQSAPVVDLDDNNEQKPPTATSGTELKAPPGKAVNGARAQLAALLAKGYTEQHPSIKKLRAELAAEEAAAKETAPVVPVPTGAVPEAAAVAAPPIPAAPAAQKRPPPVLNKNPILQAQLNTLEAEIAKHKQEQQRLSKQIASYQSRLEAIPVREQQIADLSRDYEISKAHYSQLLNSQLSAETATQLEIRQKGEKFSVLDPAQPAERPSSPNRTLIDAGGSMAGLGLGLLLALITEFLGMSITTSEQITQATGIPVLEVIPIIQTYADRVIRRRRLIIGVASAAVLAALASGAVLFHYYRS